MNNEQKNEIIKSFALGMTAEQIAYDYADEISRKKTFMERVGRA